MKRMKRLGALLLALCMLFSFAPVASAANGTIKMTLNSNTMTVNGQSVKIDTDSAIKPQVKKVNGLGYTMLPLRAVVESMGGTVAYDAATKVITMTYGGNTMKHTIGTSTATVNGAVKSMAIASYAANNRTYVHLRAIELLSSSVKVNWSASAPNDVTITYPQTTVSNGTKTVSLTIKNSCSTSFLQFTSLQLAPAGTTTYSGNLLSETLTLGGTRTLTMAIQPGKYDLKGIDMNGNVFGWKNLDFTNVQSNATLTLTTGSMFTLSVDNALIGASNSSVTIYNNTGAVITGIKAFQANSSTSTEIYSGTLYSGYYTTVALPYGSGSNVYYLTVTFATGRSLTYNYITIDQPTVTIALRGDGTFTYGGATTASGVYFVNRTGESITDLRIQLGSGGSYSTDLMDGTLKNGDYIQLSGYTTSDLRNMTVYVKVANKSSKTDDIKISSVQQNSIVLTMDSDYDLSVKYNVEPDETTYEEGLWLYNDTNLDFDYLYIINTDDVDTDDFEGDWTDVEDYFVEHDAEDKDDDDYDYEDYAAYVKNFDDGEEALVDDWSLSDLAKATMYFMGEYTDKNDKDQVIYGSVTIGKSSKFDYNVYLTLDTTSDGKTLDIDVDYDYTEDDWSDTDETGLLVWNNSGYDIKKIYFSDEELTKSNYDDSDVYDDYVSNLDDDDYDTVEEYSDYDKDVEDETIYYYVDFESSSKTDYAGSFKATKSGKDNVCLIIGSTSAKLEYDWEYEEAEDGVLYLYNDTNYDVKDLYIGIGSSKTKAQKDKNIDEISFSSFDDEECLVIDDLDLDDIDGMYIYILAKFEDSDKDDFEDVIALYDTSNEDEEFEYVALRLKSGGSLGAYYDSDADKYID